MTDCACIQNWCHDRNSAEPQLHLQRQDTHSRAWQHMLELVEEAAEDSRKVFAPSQALGSEWAQILTLPASIAKLKRVRQLDLHGSRLVRVPPEIGDMAELREFDAYTSYSLHWLPYEITRCPRLKESTISTRALYGNFKHRPHFPRLPRLDDSITPAVCSVCRRPFDGSVPQQWWISLRVATDVLPLLVHACSDDCVRRLPRPARGYVQSPHQGGSGLQQPK